LRLLQIYYKSATFSPRLFFFSSSSSSSWRIMSRILFSVPARRRCPTFDVSEVAWFSVSGDFCQPIVIHPVYVARFLILEGFHAHDVADVVGGAPQSPQRQHPRCSVFHSSRASRNVDVQLSHVLEVARACSISRLLRFLPAGCHPSPDLHGCSVGSVTSSRMLRMLRILLNILSSLLQTSSPH